MKGRKREGRKREKKEQLLSNLAFVSGHTLSSMRRLMASVRREIKRRRGNAVVPYCCVTFIVQRARDSRMQSAIFWTEG